GRHMKRLSAALDVTRATRSRLGKERALAEVFATIARDAGDEDGLGLATAARLAVGRTLPIGDGRTVGVGWSLLAAVAVAASGKAFGVDPEELRRAASLVTDPGDLVVLARDGKLNDAHVQIGRPVAYMLATPMETIASEIDPEAFVVEDKNDGIRAQVHKR